MDITLPNPVVQCISAAVVAACYLNVAMPLRSQDTPLLSGGVGFFTSTNGGNTTYLPIIEPLVAIPLGGSILIESRAALTETFFHTPGMTGVEHTHFIGLNYLQADILAQKHVNVVLGDYLIPFNTYNERLSPVWINKFQEAPLIASLGLLGTGSGLGGMLRGNLVERPKYSGTYAAFVSARSSNEQFRATRAAGARVSVFLPEPGIEAGLSYDRSLQGPDPAHENFYGAYLWWQPPDTGLRVRSEYGRGHHAHGYWVEVDYRMMAFGGQDSWAGRVEPVFRMQQTFRRDTILGDGLPLQDTKRAEFGLNYNLPHNIGILTSFSRQFSSAGDRNIWETGIVYRYLFPGWKGGTK